MLLRAMLDIKMRAKWDGPILHRDYNCLMTNGNFKYVTSVINGYTPPRRIPKLDL